MLIPEELRDITFDKSAFGYRVDDVDDYVEKVTAVINALMEENQDLEEKLEVLAAKVAEYKEDESSLQAAIVGAQKLGDSIVRDSKIKAESILREANVRAERLVEAAHRKVEVEQQNYVRIHKEVGEFRNSLMGLYKSHIDLITNLPTAEAEEKPQPVEEPVEDVIPEEPIVEEQVVAEEMEEVIQPAAEEYEEPVAETFAPVQESFEEQPIVEDDYQQEYKPRHSSRFGDLLFGQNIDIE
ncbi:MAG: DivIVA domain-containing protein [Oscillospiraceae bacterium]|nr:DivIVA domain-containing protein [Oscillospiraceae bacterium]